MTENEKSQQEVKRDIEETFTLKSGKNAPDPRALLAKHDEQRERAEREAVNISTRAIDEVEWKNFQTKYAEAFRIAIEALSPTKPLSPSEPILEKTSFKKGDKFILEIGDRQLDEFEIAGTDYYIKIYLLKMLTPYKPEEGEVVG